MSPSFNRKPHGKPHGEMDTHAEDVLDSADTQATTYIAKAAVLNLEDVNALRNPPFMH